MAHKSNRKSYRGSKGHPPRGRSGGMGSSAPPMRRGRRVGPPAGSKPVPLKGPTQTRPGMGSSGMRPPGKGDLDRYGNPPGRKPPTRRTGARPRK